MKAKKMLRFSLFFHIFSTIFCDVQVKSCDGTNDIIFPPVTYNFPEFWNETFMAPSHSPNQICRWQFNIAPGLYVSFTMVADIEQDAELQLIDSNGKIEKIIMSNLKPFIFVAPMFKIFFNTGTVAHGAYLGFRAQWFQYPKFQPTVFRLNRNNQPAIIDISETRTPLIIESDERISIVPLSSEKSINPYILRLTNVFDGSDWNSKLLGNLYDFLRSNRQITSSQSNFTIFTFPTNQSIDGFSIIVQNYSNLRNSLEVKAVNCDSTPECVVNMNAELMPSILMTVRINNDTYNFINDLMIDRSANFEIYVGARSFNSSANKIASYNSTTIEKRLPQKIAGAFQTFVLSSGTAQLILTQKSNKWTQIFDGKSGFILSKNYGNLTWDQDTSETIRSHDTTVQRNLNLFFRSNIDFGENTILTLIFYKNDAANLKMKFSKKNVPPQIITQLGVGFSLTYSTNGDSTRGFFVDFSCENVRVSTLSRDRKNYAIFWIFILIAMI